MTINEAYQKARSGDTEAEKELFRILSVRLRLIANQRVWDSTDCDDVVQEALIVISREYGSIQINTSFAAWCRKVLDNRILSYIKKKRTREFSMIEDRDFSDVASSGEVSHDLKMRLLDCLRKVAAVSPRYARILNLFYQGYTTEEVCGKLDISTTNAYTVLSRARSLLGLCLEKGDVK